MRGCAFRLATVDAAVAVDATGTAGTAGAASAASWPPGSTLAAGRDAEVLPFLEGGNVGYLATLGSRLRSAVAGRETGREAGREWLREDALLCSSPPHLATAKEGACITFGTSTPGGRMAPPRMIGKLPGRAASLNSRTRHVA